MSAPPLMGRTAMLVIALAAVAVSAHGVTATQANARKKTANAQTTRHAPPHAAIRIHEKTAAAHRATKSASKGTAPHHAPVAAAHKPAAGAAHKPTPEEVGRAAGLKIRNQLDRRAALRRSYGERRAPQLIETRYTRARYTTARAAARPIETNLAETNLVERPSSRPATVTSSGTTHYQPVDAEADNSRPAIADAERDEPAGSAETSDSESSDPETAVSAPVTTVRQSIAPQPARPTVTDADSDDSTVADSISPATRNAVHPSFASHAEVGSPAAAIAPDDRATSKREPVGENTSAYDVSEDTRLRAETEEASLTIARGYMPAPLRGNRASLERQNERLEAEGLERIEDEDDLASRIAHHLLVPVPASEALTVNGNLPANHRYCRPWTARFLSDLASAHESEFHRPLMVSSAVRTVAYQRKLMLVNGNAAPAEGDIVSPHLTGATIDIAKDNLSRAEMAWMRRHLLAIEAEGKIDVEEEFQQSCFHITVYKSYMPAYHGAPRKSQTPSEARTRKSRTVHTEVADSANTQGI